MYILIIELQTWVLEPSESFLDSFRELSKNTESLGNMERYLMNIPWKSSATPMSMITPNGHAEGAVAEGVGVVFVKKKEGEV